MAKPIPFFFCRYSLLIGDKILDYKGQIFALRKLRGRYFAHGPKAERESHLDSVVMRPKEVKADDIHAIAWSVGRKIGLRDSVEYDSKEDNLKFDSVDDPSIHYSDFVAIPHLQVMAVDDRSGAPHLGGRSAISRFNSIFHNLEDGKVNIELTTKAEDVRRAMKQWELTEFSFVVRPYNPHPAGDLSKDLSDAFKKDGIGRYRAKAQPTVGKLMKPAADGHIAAATELADEGYGQYSFKGVTPDGHTAQVKQPKFEDELTKNRQRLKEPRELRVIIATGEDHAGLVQSVVKALATFYGKKS